MLLLQLDIGLLRAYWPGIPFPLRMAPSCRGLPGLAEAVVGPAF